MTLKILQTTNLSWRPQQQHYVLYREASDPVHSALCKQNHMSLEFCLGQNNPRFEYKYPERKLQAKEIRTVFMVRLFKSCCFTVRLPCHGNTEQMKKCVYVPFVVFFAFTVSFSPIAVQTNGGGLFCAPSEQATLVGFASFCRSFFFP